MYARRRDVETVGEQGGERRGRSVCGAFRVSCFRDNIVSPPPRQIRTRRRDCGMASLGKGDVRASRDVQGGSPGYIYLTGINHSAWTVGGSPG